MAKNVSLPKGYKLNGYTISKKLSSGGFSIVYLAYNKNEIPFAIKEFFPNSLHLRTQGTNIEFINSREKQKFQEGLKGFKDETEMIMKLKHNNIIEVIDFFESNGTAYIVMPYEYGMTLSRYINIDKVVNELELALIIKGIFSAVNMFHENNIIHLDLKPGNIWLRPNKEALILDFGTARLINNEEGNTQAPMHTPGYAAPEQHREFFRPERIGPWTDYYGLGATLYALIDKNSPPPSPKLFNGIQSIDIINSRKGQFSLELLKIASELMQLKWELRKEIDLKKIISRFDNIVPANKINLLPNLIQKNIFKNIN